MGSSGQVEAWIPPTTFELPHVNAPARIDTDVFLRKVRAPMNQYLQKRFATDARHLVPAWSCRFVGIAMEDLTVQTG